MLDFQPDEEEIYFPNNDIFQMIPSISFTREVTCFDLEYSNSM